MKKKMITLLFMVGLFITAYPQSNHTIAIDGDNNGWTASEKFTDCSSADTAYFTWDADYLYFGISDAEADYGNLATFMYFDTDPDGTNGTTGAYAWSYDGENDSITTPFKADYVVVWKNESGNDYIEVRKWNGAISNWDQVASVSSNSLNSNNGDDVVNFAIGTDYREVKIKRSTIGSPSAIKVASFTEQQWGSYYRYFVWPSEGWTDGNGNGNRTTGQSIPHYRGFLLTDNVSPNNTNYYDDNIYSWTGNTNTDWGTNANWSGSTAPTSSDLVIIGSSGSPVVNESPSTPGSCFDLLIKSGAILTINTGKALTVNGTLTNNAGNSGLVIKSDASGNGSLIVDGTVSGNVTVQRYIAQYDPNSSTTQAGNGWHLLSSPVDSMAIANSDFAPGTNDDLYTWDEATNTWLNYKVDSNNITYFTDGEGYLVAYNKDSTHVFTGILNNTNDTISNLSYTSGKGNGWHLLGNPYPSALNWRDSHWVRNNIGGVAQIWDESNASYKAIVSDPNTSGDTIIPSTNGFFVQVASNTTGSITIPAAARTHNASSNFKSASATNPKETLTFKITDDANSYADESILGFRPDATKDWDIAYDAHKIMSMVKTAPQLWTVSDGQKFLINYLPEMNTAYDVPLHFHSGVNTVYHLTIKGADSFENTSLVLEDLKTGQKIDLSNTSSYDFTAEKGDDPNRFVLHINGVTAVPNVNKTDGIQVFAYGHTVYLHGQQSLNGSVSIFNTLGQQVYAGMLNGAAKQQIRLNRQQGIYFVRLEENNHVITKKIFIQ